jgi:hypothetical protein
MWQNLSTFPQHFRYKSDTRVMESDLSTLPENAVREFLAFAEKILITQ